MMLLAIPVIAPLGNAHWANAGIAGNLLLLLAGCLLAWLLVARACAPVSAALSRLAKRPDLMPVLIAGAAMEMLAASITAPVPVSDFFHYLYLAGRIAAGLSYVDDLGWRAEFPPGWPYMLAPFVAIFGPTLVAATAANVALYLVGAIGIASIARQRFGPSETFIAVVLFTIWPARLLMAGLAAKENLLIAAVIAAIALSYKAVDAKTRSPIVIAGAAGAVFGLAALTQPGLLVLTLAAPVMFRSAITDIGARRFTSIVAAMLAGALLALAPWMVRNCVVFEGEFCGIAANGGSVFYRANNANATGLFMYGRGGPLRGLPEVERNRRGYELGRQWIVTHPLDAVQLSARKVFAYLKGDDHGAYWSVLRQPGGDEENALRNASESRMALYRIASGVSLAYWVLLAALSVQALRNGRLADERDRYDFRPLVYPLLCGAAVFGLFESGDRQHMFAVGPLFVLAAAGIVRRGNRVTP
ncbi:MAG: glycosyltransferase family 39 protein [Betaproteobacteria bacterium]